MMWVVGISTAFAAVLYLKPRTPETANYQKIKMASMGIRG